MTPITRIEQLINAIVESEASPFSAVTRIESYLTDILNNTTSTLVPVTRVETYLAKISGADVAIPAPVTRIEMYLAAIAGEDIETPIPVTRLEYFLADWAAAGGASLETVTGNAPVTLLNAVAKAIHSLTQTGALKMADVELPTGYKRVKGFSMNDNCYWKFTDFKLNGSDTLRFSFSCTASCNVIGAYSGSASGNNYSLYTAAGGGNYLRYKGGAYNSGIDADTRYDVVITPTGATGMKTDSTWTALEFTTSTDFCVGTTSTSTSSAKMKGSFFGDIIVENASGERLHLIPCERVSDNELGYYDTVGDTFYAPTSGTPTSLGYDAAPSPSTPMDIVCNNGKLVARHESGLPTGYTLLESAHNLAASALVDTGLAFDNATDVEMEVKVLAKSGSWYAFQSRGTNGIRGISGSQTGNKIQYSMSSSDVIVSDISRTAGNVYLVRASTKNGVNTLYVKDLTANVEDTQTSTATATTTEDHIGIFGNGQNYIAKDTGIYYAKMWKGGALVLDLIPAKDANNAVGYYDRVSKTFLTATEGTLVADSTVTDPVNVYADGTAEVLWVGDGNKFPPNAVADVKYPVSGSGSCIVSCDVNNGTNVLAVEVHYYKADGTQINYYTLSSYDSTSHRMYKSFSLPNTAAYVSIERKAAYPTATVTDLKLEMGSTPTPYVQPTGVASVQNLLAVGDYADTQEIISGAITRKCGIKVFDGTEAWTADPINDASGNKVFSTQFTDRAGGVTGLTLFCSHYEQAPAGSSSTLTTGKFLYKPNSTNKSVYFDGGTFLSITSWKEWLAAQYAAGTPVIVVYPLAEATTESVAGQSLSTAAGTNVVSVNAEVSPIALEAEYYAKSA